MINEKDMSVETRWYYDRLAQRTVKALKANGFEAEYVPDRKKALARVLKMIPPGGTIGCGDSVTLHQIGFIDWLKKQKDHEIFNPLFLELSDFENSDWAAYSSERFRIARRALTADVFCTGTNAITIDGKLVNMDGDGNRVAPMTYGPGRVIVVSGANKIVKDVDEAIKRIKEWAAPVNNKRHVEKHGLDFIAELPCYVQGTCNNCRSLVRSCRITTIIDGWNSKIKSPTNYPPFIVIVGEFLGI